MSIQRRQSGEPSRIELVYRQSMPSIAKEKISTPPTPPYQARRDWLLRKNKRDAEVEDSLYDHRNGAIGRIYGQTMVAYGAVVGFNTTARAILRVNNGLEQVDQECPLYTALEDCAARTAAGLVTAHQEFGDLQLALALAIESRKRVFNV